MLDNAKRIIIITIYTVLFLFVYVIALISELIFKNYGKKKEKT